MDESIQSLVIRFLENTLTPDEEKKLLTWLQKHPDHVREINDFQEIWHLNELRQHKHPVSRKQELQHILQRIQEDKPQTKSTPRLFLHISRYAAIFLLGIVLSLSIAYLVSKPQDNLVSYSEISAPLGSKTRIILPDSSIIWLNADSEIRYASNFGESERKLLLTGEAFFDVVSNPEKAFTVVTSELEIKAYGTQFNVKAYPEDETVETTLVEGQVGIQRIQKEGKHSQEIKLEPNQRVVFYKDEYKPTETTPDQKMEKVVRASKPRIQNAKYLISKSIDTEQFTAWTSGSLRLSSESLEEIATELERRYDVQIRFEKAALKSLRFTGTFNDETIEQIVKAIATAANIDHEIQDRNILFKMK